MKTTKSGRIMKRKTNSQELRKKKVGTAFTTKRYVEEDEIASKKLREDVSPYVEESFSDDDDNHMDYEDYKRHHQLQRSKVNDRVSTSSVETTHLVSDPIETDEISPAQAAAMAANLPGARRRGRGPSKRPCLNRNAQMARENRQRKKLYLQSIEDKQNEYYAKNKALVGIIEKQNKQIQSLASNVNYFQALVANQSEITTLLVALNEAIKALHGSKDTLSLSNNITTSLQNVNRNLNKLSQSNQSFASNVSNNNQPVPLSGMQGFGQIARKTMPLTNAASGVSSSLSPTTKTEEPSSVESLFLDEDTHKLEQLPESHSYCKYNVMNTSTVGPGSWSINQMPTTPLSEAQSNSVDHCEASLSETDLHALSNINVDNFLFNNMDNLPNSSTDMQLSTDEIDDLLGIDETSRFNKTLFNTLNPPTGICLHVNSCRVSLEYCHICYKKSLTKVEESEIA
ncbi:uncharacterized protein LOC106645224 isoform X2 [Copidosoma floridanum]|uniref:uncharacterized protein LOC106645224 isoform X2 n=1 Tax=Copidosoma floridanum TaxID=29053 RepID=UPI0006C97DDE|nr:uncharacterized protein LOC106645224 isoform X2 [Copidosoma floridanum]